MKVLSRGIVVSAVLLGMVVVAGLLLNSRFKLYALNCSSVKEVPSFSILTFNIAAPDTAYFRKVVRWQIVDLISSEKPDIVCFQEMNKEKYLIIKPQLDSIFGPCDLLLGANAEWRVLFYSALPARNHQKYGCIGQVDTIFFDSATLAEYRSICKLIPMQSMDFEVEPGKWIRLFSGHLRSSAYSTARRSMPEGANWVRGIPLYLHNYLIGKTLRDYEAWNIRRQMDSLSVGMPVIVAGDLNDWCGSDCLDILQGIEGKSKRQVQRGKENGTSVGYLSDAWWEGGNGFGFTFDAMHLKLRLDHILYSDEIELVDVKVIDTDISDHKPLMARFRVKDN